MRVELDPPRIDRRLYSASGRAVQLGSLRPGSHGCPGGDHRPAVSGRAGLVAAHQSKLRASAPDLGTARMAPHRALPAAPFGPRLAPSDRQGESLAARVHHRRSVLSWPHPSGTALSASPSGRCMNQSGAVRRGGGISTARWSRTSRTWTFSPGC